MVGDKVEAEKVTTLVVTRRAGEGTEIVVAGRVVAVVRPLDVPRCRLAITAPADVSILREEAVRRHA